MFRNLLILGLLMVIAFAAEARSQQYEIEAISTYTFLPSGESAWDYPCEPHTFQCDFEVSGTFEVVIDSDAMTFSRADLQLSGNEDLQAHPIWPVNEETAERFLEAIGNPDYDMDLLEIDLLIT